MTDLLHEIVRLERACHDSLAHGDDAATTDVLVRTLTTVRFAVSAEDRPVVRGLANQATAHADLLLHALNTEGTGPIVQTGLLRLCKTLVDIREALQVDESSRGTD